MVTIIEESEGSKAEVAANAKAVLAEKEEIDDFFEKITEREKELVAQSAETTKYRQTIKELKKAHSDRQKKHSEEHDAKKEELVDLIQEAKAALNLSNAVGLSREFESKVQGLRPGIGLKFQKGFPFVGFSNATAWWLIFSMIFFEDAAILDPFLGWEQTLDEDAAEVPWFGAAAPETFGFVFREFGSEAENSLGRSGFNWIGNYFSVIGNKAPEDCKKWWERLKRYIKKSSTGVPWPGELGSGKTGAYAFPEAYQQLVAGRPRDINP